MECRDREVCTGKSSEEVRCGNPGPVQQLWGTRDLVTALHSGKHQGH